MRAALAADTLTPADERSLMRAVAAARLLVPIVAEPAEVDESGPLAVEKQTDMAAVTLVAPDGARALPVFSSMAALAAWDPSARPVPVTAARAAQAAVSERCDVMVLDVAGPRTVALRPSMVWALAQQREWVPAHEDETVCRALELAVRDQDGVLAHDVGPGAAGEGVLQVSLTLGPGLDQRHRAAHRDRHRRAPRHRRRDPGPDRRTGLLDLLGHRARSRAGRSGSE